jgi:hypothetical protein
VLEAVLLAMFVVPRPCCALEKSEAAVEAPQQRERLVKAANNRKTSISARTAAAELLLRVRWARRRLGRTC